MPVSKILLSMNGPKSKKTLLLIQAKHVLRAVRVYSLILFYCKK